MVVTKGGKRFGWILHFCFHEGLPSHLIVYDLGLTSGALKDNNGTSLIWGSWALKCQVGTVIISRYAERLLGNPTIPSSEYGASYGTWIPLWGAVVQPTEASELMPNELLTISIYFQMFISDRTIIHFYNSLLVPNNIKYNNIHRTMWRYWVEAFMWMIVLIYFDELQPVESILPTCRSLGTSASRIIKSASYYTIVAEKFHMFQRRFFEILKRNDEYVLFRKHDKHSS